ncbi:MAG: DUF6773 family protein [Anaerovoracaceae bacterium]
MEENKIQDERILSERREVQSKGYEWIIYILTITIIVQQFFMRAPFSQFAVEFFLLFGCAIYNAIANYRKGIDIWNPSGAGKGKIFISSIVSGAACAITLAFLSGEHKISMMVLNFIVFVVFMFAIRLTMISINNKKQQAIDKELNMDDDIIE